MPKINQWVILRMVVQVLTHVEIHIQLEEQYTSGNQSNLDSYLNPNGTPKQGIFFRYGICSQTPYVYNAQSEVMVSFDNAALVVAKGKYILETKLRDFSVGNRWRFEQYLARLHQKRGRILLLNFFLFLQISTDCPVIHLHS